MVARVAFCVSVAPAIPLKWTSFKGNRQGWAEVDKPELKDNRKHFLAQGDYLPAMVISHNCALDKQKEAGEVRVLVAPVLSIDGLEPEMRRTVLQQDHLALLPLPEIPTLGTHYADLRMIMPVQRSLIKDTERVASMTEKGLERLYAQVFKFIMRKEPPSIET